MLLWLLMVWWWHSVSYIKCGFLLFRSMWLVRHLLLRLLYTLSDHLSISLLHSAAIFSNFWSDCRECIPWLSIAVSALVSCLSSDLITSQEIISSRGDVIVWKHQWHYNHQRHMRAKVLLTSIQDNNINKDFHATQFMCLYLVSGWMAVQLKL